MHICLSAGGPSSWVWFIPENDSDSELVFNKKNPCNIDSEGFGSFFTIGSE